MTLKRFILCILFIIINSSLFAGEVILSGKIDNMSSDTVVIANFIKDYIILVEPDGSFNEKLELIDGYYYLEHGDEYTNLFLQSGYDLFITVDTEVFDESLQYEGEGSENNNFIAKKVNFLTHIEPDWMVRYLLSCDEEKFLHELDSISQLKLNFLKSNQSSLTPYFYNLELTDMRYNAMYLIATYEGNRRFMGDDRNYTVSSDFPNIMDSTSINHELLSSSNYSRFKQKALYSFYLDNIYKDKGPNKFLRYLDFVDSVITDQDGKDNFLIHNYSYYSLKNKNAITFYEKMEKLFSYPPCKAEMRKRFEEATKTAKGMPSSPFEFVDNKGDTVKLSDYLGQLVYIDLWASWCTGCIQEFPMLKEVKVKYKDKDVVFIGIAWNDEMEAWKKALSTYNLGENQLFATNENARFFKDYHVTGIPRFILIDKKGNIIASKAPRPSDDALIRYLDEALLE